MPETKPLAKALDAQLRAAFSNLVERVRQMPPAQQKRLGLLAVLAVAVLAGLIWYGTRTDWKTLYGGLDASDARTMAQQLTKAGIPYDMSPDGTALRVPAQDLDKARLVATAGGGPAGWGGGSTARSASSLACSSADAVSRQTESSTGLLNVRSGVNM